MASAALRDFDLRTSEMMFTTPVTRGAYLGGRFVAGYLACLAILLVCELGLLLGGLMPWVEQARLGPLHASGYLWAFGVMAVPSMLFIAGLLFLLATTTRSLLATYIGVIAYFGLQVVAGMLTRDVNNHVLAAMLDPFGGRTLAIVTRYWTSSELNHDLPKLQGPAAVQPPAVEWRGAGAAGRRLRAVPHQPRRPAAAAAQEARGAADAASARRNGRRLRRRGDARITDQRARLQQLRRQFAFDTAFVLRGVPFVIMLILALVNLVAILALSGQLYGTATYPVTHRMLETVQGGFQVMLFIIVTFYAGELVWRERGAGVAEVSDAFPTAGLDSADAPNCWRCSPWSAYSPWSAAWSPSAGSLRTATRHLQPGLYLGTLLLDALPYLLLAVLAVFLQVLSQQQVPRLPADHRVAGGQPDRLRPAALGRPPVQLRHRTGHAVFGPQRLRPFPAGRAVVLRLLELPRGGA